MPCAPVPITAPMLYFPSGVILGTSDAFSFAWPLDAGRDVRLVIGLKGVGDGRCVESGGAGGAGAAVGFRRGEGGGGSESFRTITRTG